MTFNLLGPPTKDDIRVKYIDPDLGLVEGVTICQANEYALKNPGTTFIFRDGNNNIKYLNINEVNSLDPNILISTDDCGGISEKKECGAPTIQFFGGGGIGAEGNPVIGRDGALLAVDVVRGGNGYQYPPLVAARDKCNYGSGATLTAVLGEVAETIETYENESDFEDYEICEDSEVGYGRRYGPDGEDLGPWEPRLYTDPGEDPIRKEVEEFQEIVRKLGRKPFFSSLKNKPTNIVCSDPKVLPQVYDVGTKWGPESFNPNEFMSSYAISPVPPSNVRGSDYAGRLFTFEWTEDFPTDGEYVFRMLCDNVADLYVDNLKITSLKNMWGSTSKGGAVEPVIPVQKTIKKGIHKIRVDLLNLPFYETKTTSTQQQSVSANVVDVNFNVKTVKSSTFASTFKIQELGINISKPAKSLINETISKKVEVGKVYTIEIDVPQSNGITLQVKGKTLEVEDLRSGTTRDLFCTISNGRFFDIKNGIKKATCKFIVDKNKANTSSTSVVASTPSTQSNIEIKKVFNTVDFIGKANRTLWRSKVAPIRDGDFVLKYGVLPFDPDSAEAQTRSFTGTHTIVWSDINFPVDGSYNIELWADDRVTLTITNNSGFKEVIRKDGYKTVKKTIAATGKSVETRTFKAGKYKIQADLFQSNVAPLASKDNPMILAVNIDAPTVTETIISQKSWNENAVAVALTIDAPDPAIPQEPKPQQEGRCPPNPIWSTRFPGAKEQWYPVTYIGEKIERTIETSALPEKQTQETQEVEFSIFGQGKPIGGYSFTFTAVDGQHTFTLNNVQKSKETRVEKIRIRKGVNYVVVASHKDNIKLEQGLIKQGTKKREGGIGESNKIFADGVKTANDNDDIQVTTNLGKFISLNKAKVGGRTTFELTYVLEGSTSAGITNSPTKTIITTDGWSKFFNRYAISPVPPLDTPGSDAGGVLFTNSWELDIPYDGFYKFAVQRDNTARLYVDGKLAFDVKTSGDDIWRDFRNKPKFQKVFITKGRHTIGVELQNQSTETFDQVNQLIFRTADWQVGAPVSTNTIDVDFTVKGPKSTTRASAFKIQDLTIDVSKPARTAINQTISKKVEVGKTYLIEIDVPQSKGITLKIKGQTLEVEDLRSSTTRDLFCTISKGKFFDIKNGAKKATCKFIVGDKIENPPPTSKGLGSGTVRNGVTYQGPTIVHHKDGRWGSFMNFQSISPLIPGEAPDSNGRKRFIWKGVKFPESGQYDIRFLADNDAKLFIGGREVLRAQGPAENPQVFQVNITQGTYDIIVDSEYPYTTPETNTKKYFSEVNPTGFGLAIRKNVTIKKDYGKSWKENPIGIGAILIPPPCPRRIRGRGVVERVDVIDTGNGYLIPNPPTPPPPIIINLEQRDVPGLPPGSPPIVPPDAPPIVPPDAPPIVPPGVPPTVSITPPGPPTGPPGVPPTVSITPPGAPAVPTGVNARFIPQFEVVRDPPVVDPTKIIQVTDLVGLKQTGYVNGRPYYGAVFYKDGVRYAGFYETVGALIQIYDTLKESIDAQVTTAASAILRQGTDIRSNDPRLNIPGTPQSITSLSDTTTLSTSNNATISNTTSVNTPIETTVQQNLQDPTYPVALRLSRILIENPGINYNETDQIRITPSNGAVLKPLFGPFGTVVGVEIINPGFGFTEYPRIEMFTPS